MFIMSQSNKHPSPPKLSLCERIFFVCECVARNILIKILSAQYSIIHNSQDKETTQMCTDRQMNLLYTYNGIFLSLKKE